MFLLYCFRTLRCLVFPMTLVVNMSDPMTEVRANSQQQLEQMQQAAKAQLAMIEEKAAERQRQMEAEATAKHQANLAERQRQMKADAEHRAKLAKQAAMPARRLPPHRPPVAAQAVKAPAVKPKGSVAECPLRRFVDPQPTAVKAKAKAVIPDRKTALANIQAVMPKRYSAASSCPPLKEIKLPIPDEKARAEAAEICSRVFGQKSSAAKLGDEQLQAKAASAKAFCL